MAVGGKLTMKKSSVLFLSILVAVSTAAQAQGTKHVVRQDSALDEIVSPDAIVEKLASSFVATNGPVWVRKGGYLLFSDPPANIMYKWEPRDSKVSVFLDRSGFTGTDTTGLGREIGSNGTTLDRQGRVVYCNQGDRQIVRLEEDGRRTILASEYEGKRLSSPNDLVYKSNGSLYFTDPPGKSVFLLKDGKLQLLTKDMESPNGLAFSPDEKNLYISDPRKRTITRFDVQGDGTIANGKIFLDLNPHPLPWLADALKVDEKGDVYSQGPGGLWIISPEGKHLGTILVPERPTSQAFGDADGKTLYITARTSVYRVRLKVPGIRP